MHSRRSILRTGVVTAIAGSAGCTIRTGFDENAGSGVVWERRYAALQTAGFRRVVPASDGGFFAVGFTSPRIEDDSVGGGGSPWEGYVVRTDREGNERWHRRLAPIRVLLDAIETPDGGLVAVGVGSSSGNAPADGWAVRLAANGGEEWRRELSSDGNSELWAVTPGPDGGYVLGGAHGTRGPTQSAWLVHVDGDGTVRRDIPTLLPGIDSSIRDIVTTPEGIVLTGPSTVRATRGSETYEFAAGLVAGVTPEGAVRWARQFGGDLETELELIRVEPSSEGYVLLGVRYSDPSEPLLVTVDGEGTAVRGHTYAPTESDRWFRAEDLTTIPDDGVLVAGNYGEPQDATGKRAVPVVAKVSPDGEAVEWARTYGGTGARAQSVVALEDGYVLGGETPGERARLLRFDVPPRPNVSLQVSPVQLPEKPVDS